MRTRKNWKQVACVVLVGAALLIGTSIDYTLLPNEAPPSLKGHYFEGNEQPLADVLTKRLSELGL
jgi:hypothetical protein